MAHCEWSFFNFLSFQLYLRPLSLFDRKSSVPFIYIYTRGFPLLVLASLSKINEAIRGDDAAVILACLQLPSAKLNNVRPNNAEIYMIILKDAKSEKAEVSIVN